MELDTWRRQHNLSAAQLAERLGIDGRNPARTVQRYLKNERTPDRGMIRQIALVTDGAVTDADFPVREREAPASAERVPA